MNLKKLLGTYDAVVIFDTQTTGLDADTGRIINLAAMRFDRGGNSIEDLNLFVKLPEGERIPKKIVELTGITDKMLEQKGMPESYVCAAFSHIIRNDEGPVLLIAHNAQLGLLFVREMIWRHKGNGEEMFETADYLDTMTVYKDRAASPHDLDAAIKHYEIKRMPKDNYRAIDNVVALIELCKVMDGERDDLDTYVNIFGYHPIYGVSGYRLDGVTYWPQHFNKGKVSPMLTLPELARRNKQ